MNTKNAALFRQLKAKHPDAILLLRQGKQYQAYNDDAKTVADILGLNLSVKLSADPKALKGQITKQCSFQHYELEMYLPKLVRAGKRVAICDQLDDPNLTKRGNTERRPTIKPGDYPTIF